MGRKWGNNGAKWGNVYYFIRKIIIIGVIGIEIKKIWRGCPKCNAPPKDVGMFLDAGALYVKCLKCGAYTDTYNCWADAIDAWNKGMV